MDRNDKLEHILEVAESLGIQAEVIRQKPTVLELRKGLAIRYFVFGLLPFNSTTSAKLARDKDLTKEILRRAGINTPKGFLVGKWEDVLRLLQDRELSFPLVAKPNTEALGKGVVAGIKDENELKTAFTRLASEFEEILVEQFIEGDDHRFMVFQGEVLAVAKRIQPRVVGNGVSRVGELIEEFYRDRKKKVRVDHEVERVLSRQDLSMDSVPPTGQTVSLRSNANIYTGGLIEDVTDKVAPEYKELAVKAAKLLSLVVAGVDLLTKDVSNYRDDYAITEVNSVPGYDIHQTPDKGAAYDFTPRMLEALFE